MTKSHNSCRTCNIAKCRLYGHLHVMLVTVYGYEQNTSRSVGGFQDFGISTIGMVTQTESV